MSNRQSFKDVALAVREIVDAHGGAIVMTRDELCQAVIESNSHLVTCSDKVFSHITAPLRRRQGLAHCAFQGEDGSILLVFDPRIFDANSARGYCISNGLSPDVEIALMEGVLV